MEALEQILAKLAEQGPLGLALVILIGLSFVLSYAIRTLYRDNQALHRENQTDAKEFARGLAAGVATLDAVKELVMYRRSKR